MLLRLEQEQESPGNLVTVQAGLVSLGWARRFAFLTRSWEVSVLLVWATH